MKESLNREGQQFHQYHQNSLNTKKTRTTTCNVWKPSSALGQACNIYNHIFKNSLCQWIFLTFNYIYILVQVYNIWIYLM